MVPPVRIGRAENRRTSHEGIGPCGGDLGDVVDLDATIDLQPDVAAAARLLGIDALPCVTQLGQRSGDEGLPPETGVDRHEQHDVELVQRVVQPRQRRGRVEHQPRLAATRADQLQGPVHVRAGLGVEGDDVGTCIGKGSSQRIHRRDHQVHVDGHADVRSQRLADHGSHRQVGNIVVVHHVEMQKIRACGLDGLHFFLQPAEVGRKHAGSDPVCHVACPALEASVE